MSESELFQMSAGEIAGAVRGGELAAPDVAEAFLERIDQAMESHAFITVAREYALRRARGVSHGRLAGVPLAVKDMLDTAGIRTTYGSKVFRDHVPSRTARAVSLLEAEGAILIGKANQHEFAWGTTSQNPFYGDVVNPRDPSKVSGGSSGGNAAALAGGLCVIGLGTDTGGSVRIPSACCGTVGFKPAFGEVSTDGVFGLASSLDTVGPMARSVADCALMYEILTSVTVEEVDLSGLRIGVISPTGLEPALEAAGAILVDFAFPQPEDDLSLVYYAECAKTHSELFASRRDDYSDDVRAKLDGAGKILPVEYARALDSLHRFRERANASLEVDALIGPVLAASVPEVGCWEPDVREGLGGHTRVYNYLGWAAVAIGNLQVGGPASARVLGIAQSIESLLPDGQAQL